MKKFLCLLLCAALALTLSVPSLAQGEARDEDHFTLLLLGTDKAGLTKEEAKTKGRADAVVIVSLDLKWGDVRMASLERDLRVQIPETFQGETLIAGANKLCTSSFFAGPPLTRQLINETLRLDIGYYAAVDIGGMGKIVDALGGVEVEIGEEDLDMRVDGRKVFSSTGIKAMRGKMATQYMQYREVKKENYDPDTDVQRNERQRKVLVGCMKKLTSLGVNDLMKAVAKLLPLVRTNLDVTSIWKVARAVIGTGMLSGGLQDMRQMRFPQHYTRTYENLHRVVIADDLEQEIQALHTFLYARE